LSNFLKEYAVPYKTRVFVFPDEKFGKDNVHLMNEEARRQYADALLAEATPLLSVK
jgi:hypothetical protein